VFVAVLLVFFSPWGPAAAGQHDAP
jgi:hypothetical protein